MNCPLCGTKLEWRNGNKMYPDDPKHGVSCWCPAPYPSVCSAQEVLGHGNTANDAYVVVLAKYKKCN